MTFYFDDDPDEDFCCDTFTHPGPIPSRKEIRQILRERFLFKLDDKPNISKKVVGSLSHYIRTERDLTCFGPYIKNLDVGELNDDQVKMWVDKVNNRTYWGNKLMDVWESRFYTLYTLAKGSIEDVVYDEKILGKLKLFISRSPIDVYIEEKVYNPSAQISEIENKTELGISMYKAFEAFYKKLVDQLSPEQLETMFETLQQ